jgi:hypothetical protein
MVRFLDSDADDAVRRLALVGTEIVATTDEASEQAVVARVLPIGERGVRVEVDIEPPDDVFSAMGAWHVNARTEAHTVRSGRGVVEFVTPAGVVSAELGAGDVMVVRGAEHRYRPLTAQRWAIRHSGPDDAELDPRDTGRPSETWPLDA